MGCGGSSRGAVVASSLSVEWCWVRALLHPWSARLPFARPCLPHQPPRPPGPSIRSTVRVFEGIKDKSPDDATYAYVVGELKPVMDELNLSTPEELGI